ncbi:MAG: 5-(carboxyamino)imidazole ribonucleotide mutase [Desulfotomaculales bacterium]
MGEVSNLPRVGIVVGSDSDLPLVREAAGTLAQLGIEHEVVLASAHRTPDRAVAYARDAAGRRVGVIIAAAGLAAHLPGVLAAHTTLPVIGLPVAVGALAGRDALYSMVQMPPGVPVATVGIGAAQNAALLAARILAVGDAEVRRRLEAYVAAMRAAVEQKADRLAEVGLEAYLAERGAAGK